MMSRAGYVYLSWWRAFFFVFVFACLPLFTGCGFKDKPVAPQYLVPRAIDDLRYAYAADGVTLSWSYPKETVSGDDLDEIVEFRLYRAAVPVDDYCEGCPLPFGDPITLPGGTLPRDDVKTGNHEVGSLVPGHLYFFKLRSRNGWWTESKDSNIISLLWYSPPIAPQGWAVDPGDGENILSWQAVTRHQDGSPMTRPVLYQVFRGEEGGSFVELGEPFADTHYVDSDLENGRSYSYRVQAINEYEQGTVLGVMSDTAEGSPVDLTPPPPPTGVQALRTEAGVKVFWDSAQAPDLAGYRVYRRSAGQGTVQIGTTDLSYTIFIDETAPRGKTLFYSVSSIDEQTPPNESQRSAEARAID